MKDEKRPLEYATPGRIDPGIEKPPVWKTPVRLAPIILPLVTFVAVGVGSSSHYGWKFDIESAAFVSMVFAPVLGFPAVFFGIGLLIADSYAPRNRILWNILLVVLAMIAIVIGYSAGREFFF